MGDDARQVAREVDAVVLDAQAVERRRRRHLLPHVPQDLLAILDADTEARRPHRALVAVVVAAAIGREQRVEAAGEVAKAEDGRVGVRREPPPQLGRRRAARGVGGPEDGRARRRVDDCLLYTSPSPRDRG